MAGATWSGVVGACSMVGLLVVLAGRSIAAAPPRSADRPLPYRRVLLPPDQLEAWSKHAVRYLPLDRAEFHRRIERVGRANLGAPADDLPRIGRALYEARLDEAAVLRGTARLDVRHHGDHPALLPLDPCDLAISQVHWDPLKGEKAVLGNSASGALAVVVDRSSTLGFLWSRRATRRQDGRLTFALQFPASASKQLRVELPRDRVLRVPDGRVVREAIGASSGSEAMTRRWWRVDLGHHNRVSLEVTTEATRRIAPPPPSVRQRITYRIAPRGLEATAQFTIDAGGAAGGSGAGSGGGDGDTGLPFPIWVDPSLRVVDVMVGTTHRPWRLLANGTEGAGTIIVNLNGPIPADGQVVRVVALGPVVAGGRWHLPRVRPAAARWESGSMELLVTSPLTLNRLERNDCRQVDWEPIAVPYPGESFEIEAFSPAASLDVWIGYLDSTNMIRTGTTISLGPREVTATTIAAVTIASGSYFDLQAEVGGQWMIDTVASDPPEALTGWRQQRADRAGGRLVVNLSHALAPGRGLQLTVTGRLQRSGLVGPLHIETLEMLHFRTSHPPLLLLRSADPFQLAISGDQRLTIRDPARLDAAEAALFPDLRPGLLFESDRNADTLAVSLVRKRPRFDAEIEAATVIDGGTLDERFTFQCVPKLASIDRLLVHVLAAEGPPWRWSVAGGEEENEPASRRLSGAERAAWGTERPGDVWEITLRHSQVAPFQLKAERTLPFRGPHQVNLASLLEADRQRARVTVAVEDGQDVEVRNSRLRPIPTGLVEWRSGVTVRASFRYEPRHDLTAAAASPLVVIPSERPPQPVAWIWKCQLDTWAAADGATQHQVTYWLQNRGRAAIDFQLLAGSELRSVTLDGRPVAAERMLVRNRDLRITLPSQRQFLTVTVCFVQSDPPLKILGVRYPVWPVCSLPVLERAWVLWLAPEDDLLPLPGGDAPLHGPSNGRFPSLVDRVRLPPTPCSGGNDRGRAGAGRGNALQRPHPTWSGPLPWKRLDPRTPHQVGWRAAHWSEAEGGIPTRVTILHRPAVKVAAWILFLFSAIVISASRMRRISSWAAAAGLAVTVSLVLPTALVPLGIAVLAGMACGAVVRSVRWLGRPGSRFARIARRPAAGQVAGLGVAVATLLVPVTRTGEAAEVQGGQKQAVSSTDQASGPVLYQVLVPVDAQRKPIGNQVYLAEPFLRELLRRDLAASTQPRDGMVTRATYHATLVRDTVAKRLIVRDLKASFEVIVFDTTRGVSIALPRKQTGWDVVAGAVDGHVVKLQWNAAERAFTFPVDDPGRYRLAVTFQPRVGENTDGIDLAIPRVNQTQLRLAVTNGTDPYELPTVRGAIAYHRERRSVVAELGPADRLVVERPSQRASGVEKAELEIDAMTWLHVRPGAVLVDAKWRVRPLRGRIRDVRLRSGPRLRLLPFPKDGPVESVATVPGPGHEVRLQLRHATSDAVTIDARFLVRGSPGIGRLPLPHPRLVGGRVIRRRLAVSVDQRLEYREFDKRGLQAIPISEFRGAWGNTSEEPTLAYAIPAGEVDWQLATQPRTSKATVTQRHDLLVELGRASLSFQAQFTTDFGYRFGYQLDVPESFEVDRLSVTDGGERCSARWARADATTVCVFLNEPVTGTATLSLHGTLAIPRQGHVRLPVIAVVGAEVRSNQYQIRRRYPLRVDVQTGAGFQSLPAAIDAHAIDPQTPLVAAFTIADRTADATLAISANRPQVNGCGVTSLHREGGTWVADWEARVEVRGAEVGQIVVDVPGWWSGPYRVSPTGTLEMIDLPSLDLRRLVLRPNRPIRDGQRLRIAAPLDQTADQQIRLPDIRPRTSGSWRRLVRLPKIGRAARPQPKGPGTGSTAVAGAEPADRGLPSNRSAGVRIPRPPKTFVWEMRGLRPARATEIPDWIEPSDDQPLWLRVVGRRGLVVQNIAVPVEGTPEITLAEVQIVTAGTGPRCGLASFDLLPAGLRDCIVELPGGGRLIQVLLEGRSSTLAHIADHRWRLTLESDRLPQRIGVLFDPGIAAAASAHARCQAPKLVTSDGPIAVRQTQWTVYGPTGDRSDDARVGAVQYTWARMQQMARLLDRSRSTWDSVPAGVRTGWYRAWWERLRASGRRLEQLCGKTAGAAAVVPGSQRTDSNTQRAVPHGQKTALYDRVLQQAGKLLAARDPRADPSLPQVAARNEPSMPGATETPERWFADVFEGLQPATHWLYRGPRRTIDWQPAGTNGQRIPKRWLPAGVALLLTLLAFGADRKIR